MGRCESEFSEEPDLPGGDWRSDWPPPAKRWSSGPGTTERADGIARGLVSEWPDHSLSITGASNEITASCDLVVVATPWDSAVATVKPLAPELAGKVVVSMANALVKEGREFIALLPPRGSVAASIQAALPHSLVSASFHHLPASEMEKLTRRSRPMSWSAPTTPRPPSATVALVERIEGLRGVDAGSLAQAAPIEAFTAVLITINIRHKVHAAVQLTGFGRALTWWTGDKGCGSTTRPRGRSSP